MSDTGETMFQANELVSIHLALQSQIEECEAYLRDPSIPINEKTQLARTLKYSKSALDRIEAILAYIDLDSD